MNFSIYITQKKGGGEKKKKYKYTIQYLKMKASIGDQMRSSMRFS